MHQSTITQMINDFYISAPSVTLCKSVADIAFILDSSGSVGKKYKQEKNLIKSLIKAFELAKGGTHAGVVTFSRYATLSIKLNQYFTLSSFDKAVDDIPLMRGGTRIDRALKLASNELLKPGNGARKNVPKIVILLTDGLSRGKPVPIAEKMRKDGITIIAVGITQFINKKQLTQISGGKFYHAKDLAVLKSKSFVGKLAKTVCLSAVTGISFHWIFAESV